MYVCTGGHFPKPPPPPSWFERRPSALRSALCAISDGQLFVHSDGQLCVRSFGVLSRCLDRGWNWKNGLGAPPPPLAGWMGHETARGTFADAPGSELAPTPPVNFGECSCHLQKRMCLGEALQFAPKANGGLPEPMHIHMEACAASFSSSRTQVHRHLQ